MAHNLTISRAIWSLVRPRGSRRQCAPSARPRSGSGMKSAGSSRCSSSRSSFSSWTMWKLSSRAGSRSQSLTPRRRSWSLSSTTSTDSSLKAWSMSSSGTFWTSCRGSLRLYDVTDGSMKPNPLREWAYLNNSFGTTSFIISNTLASGRVLAARPSKHINCIFRCSLTFLSFKHLSNFSDPLSNTLTHNFDVLYLLLPVQCFGN